MKENKTIQIEIPADLEYFYSYSDDIWKILKRYHNVAFFYEAKVKSNPTFLNSDTTGNAFAKFTLMFRSPLPFEKRKAEKNNGDVYIDCMAFENKKNSPGGFILQNLKKGCLVSGISVLRSGQKPVKHENDEFRANWVYGDYLYINIREIKIDKEAKEERFNPYKDRKFFSDNPDFCRYNKSKDQYVTDDDLIFDI